MRKIPFMKENRLTIFGKSFIVFLFVLCILSALVNILRQNVPHPMAFIVAFIGFTLFLIGKISVIKRKQLISFGTRNMTENMANAYRLGYWLMVVGVILTFN